MVFRTYVCKKCGAFQEVTLESIFSDKPDTVPCLEEGCDGLAKYDIRELRESTTIIPAHMRSESNGNMKYNKIPREKRKFK